MTDITITIDPDHLSRCEDEELALFWHVAQANPAPFGDHEACDLVEKVGREIIRRWLKATPPQLWKRRGGQHEWSWLTQFARYEPPEPPPGVRGFDPNFHRGIWVAKDQAPAAGPAGGGDEADGRGGD